MNRHKTLKTLATLAAAFGLTFAAEAKNYTTILTNDFEDATTYTENMSGGSVTNALFGTSTSSSSSLPGTPTQDHRTVVGSATGSNFYSIKSTWSSGNLLFTIPDTVTNAVSVSKDYIVEFDYYLNFITTSTYSGLAIQGANGPIATFYAKPGSKSGESTDGKLYLGDTTDTELITQVKGYKREADPSSSNCDKYWMHVTIKGVNTESDPTKNGLFMTVVRNNQNSPATLLAETRVGDFDVVTHLFQRFSTGNNYTKYVSLDDVLVKTAVAAKTYTWTGAEDNRWENAANWTVGGEATEFYPGAEDTVVIALENQQIAVSPNVAFGTFQTLADSTTFTVLFSEEGQTFTIPTEKVAAGKFSVSQPFTDSTELSGNIYTAGTRAAATYTWIGGDGVWNDAKNWRIAGATTGVWPTTGDSASFTAAANGAVVSLAAGTVISGATIAEGATITYDGSAGEVELAGNVEGAGTLVLSNVTWKTTSAQRKVYIGVAIDVPAESTANFHIHDVKNDTGYGFAVTNKFTGSGTIAGYSTGGNNTWDGLHLNGDGSEFGGTVKFYSSTSQSRDKHSLEPLASSSNAVWRFYVDAVPKALGGAPFQKEGTYYLGAVQYKLYDKNTAEKVTYEIGALDQDSYIESVSSKFGSSNNINWIAPTATFTCAVSNVNILATLGGGTIVIASEGTLPTGRIYFDEKGGTLKTRIVDGVKIDPSARFTKCKAAICFDDEGEDYTWATAIDKTNTGGFTKKGAGTLTIKSAALNGALQVLGGKIAVDETVTAAGQTLLSWDVVAGAQEVTHNDFALATAPAALGYAIVTNDTKISLVTQRVPADYTFKGGDGGLWSDATNWTVSSTETPFVPSTDDNATINAAVVVTTAVGQVVKTLTLADGAKLAFDLTGIAKNEQVTLFAVGAGQTCPLTEANVLISGYDSDAYAVKYDTSDTTKITVGLYGKTTFVWTGKGENNYFGTVGNWAYGATNGPAATACPNSDSTLIFPEPFADGVTVEFDRQYYPVSGMNVGFVSAINVGCNVTFASTSDTDYAVGISSVSGTGTLSLSHIDLRTGTYGTPTIEAPLCIVGSTMMYLRGSNAKITVNGTLTGSGTLTVRGDGNPSKNYVFNGDASGFAGRLVTVKNTHTDNGVTSECVTTYLRGNARNLGAAALEVGGQTYIDALDADATLKVGSLLGTGKLYNNTDYAVTLEVGARNEGATNSVWLTGKDGSGAWTIKKVGTARQTFTNTAMTNNIELVEGELMLPENTVAKNVTCTAGKFVFDYNKNWTVGTATNVMTMTSCMGTIARDNVVIDGIPAAYDWTVDCSQTAIAVTITEDITYVWTNGSGDKLWTTAGNWKLSNGHPASKFPESTDKVKLGADAVVVVTPGQTFGTVTAESAAKLAVLVSAEGSVGFTAPEGFDTANVIAAGPFTMSYSEGTWTATRVPSTFTWVGTDGDWATVSNWKVGECPTAVIPGSDDTATFPAELESVAVAFTSHDRFVSNVVANADLTVSGTAYLRANCICGDGLLTLNGAKVMCNNANLDISNDVCVATGTDNELRTSANKDSTFTRINLYGKLSGEGNIKANHGSRQNGGVAFYGDNHAFGGTFETSNFNSRDGTDMGSYIASSSNAVWKVSASNAKSTTRVFPSTDDAYKYFGAYIGQVWSSSGTKLEIGYRDDVESTLYAYVHVSYGGHTIRKIGSNVLNLKYNADGNARTKVAAIYLCDGTVRLDYDLVPETIKFEKGGVLAFTDNVRDLSACIKGSAAAITIDDGGTNATWATALAASNKGGFVKKGNGTLTLTEAPLYEGTTTVKEGKLILPSGSTVTLGEKTQSNVITIGEVEWLELKPADATIETKVTGSDETLDVTVSQDWVASELVGKKDKNGNVYTQETASEALTNATLNANGLPAWQSYALGLEPTVATSLPYVTPQQTTSATTLTLNLAGVAPKSSSETGTTVLYKIETADTPDGFTGDVTGATSDTTYTVDLPETGAQYYRVNIKFDKPSN